MEVRMTKFEVVMMMWEVRLANLNQPMARDPRAQRTSTVQL